MRPVLQFGHRGHAPGAVVVVLLLLAGSELGKVAAAPPQPTIPWRQRASFAGNSNEQMKVLSLAFSPDSRLVVSASEGGRGKDFEAPAQVILWDTRAGKRVRTLTGHDCFSVTSILFFPDGKTLASGSRDGTVKLWDLNTGKLQRTLKVGAAQSRPDEFLLTYVTCLALAADGRTIAVGTGWGWVVLWDVQTGQVKHRLEHANGIKSIAFSSDGKLLATLARHVRLWDVSSGYEKKKMLNESAGAWTIAFSPDAKLLASGGDGKVCLWDARTTQLKRRLEAAGESIFHLAFSADGQSLIGAGNGGTVFVWDVQSGKVEHKLPTGSVGAKPLALSPDDRLLATGGKANTIILWEARKTAD